MKWLDRLAHAVLVAAVLFEGVLLALGFVGRRQLQQSMLQPGAELSGLSGYQADIAGGPFRAAAGCVLYRMVSHRCVVCGREEPDWKRFMRDEAGSRCQMVVLLPGLEPVPYYPKSTAMGAVPQIAWVPLDWAEQVRLFETPTTILTRGGRIAWVREGAMDAQSFSALRDAMDGPGQRE